MELFGELVVKWFHIWVITWPNGSVADWLGVNITGWLRELMFGWFFYVYFGLFSDWLIIRLDERDDLMERCLDELVAWWWRDWLKLWFGDLTKGLLSKWVSDIFIEWVVLRLDSEGICEVCAFLNGLLVEWWFGIWVIRRLWKMQIGRIVDDVSKWLNIWMNSGLGYSLILWLGD